MERGETIYARVAYFLNPLVIKWGIFTSLNVEE